VRAIVDGLLLSAILPSDAGWRRRFADRIFPLTEGAALAYGDIMSATL
jgi:predicted nucleic acid-binding protein